MRMGRIEQDRGGVGGWQMDAEGGGHDNAIRACPVKRKVLVYQTYYNG